MIPSKRSYQHKRRRGCFGENSRFFGAEAEIIPVLHKNVSDPLYAIPICIPPGDEQMCYCGDRVIWQRNDKFFLHDYIWNIISPGATHGYNAGLRGIIIPAGLRDVVITLQEFLRDSTMSVFTKDGRQICGVVVEDDVFYGNPWHQHHKAYPNFKDNANEVDIGRIETNEFASDNVIVPLLKFTDRHSRYEYWPHRAPRSMNLIEEFDEEWSVYYRYNYIDNTYWNSTPRSYGNVRHIRRDAPKGYETIEIDDLREDLILLVIGSSNYKISAQYDHSGVPDLFPPETLLCPKGVEYWFNRTKKPTVSLHDNEKRGGWLMSNEDHVHHWYQFASTGQVLMSVRGLQVPKYEYWRRYEHPEWPTNKVAMWREFYRLNDAYQICYDGVTNYRAHDYVTLVELLLNEKEQGQKVKYQMIIRYRDAVPQDIEIPKFDLPLLRGINASYYTISNTHRYIGEISANSEKLSIYAFDLSFDETLDRTFHYSCGVVSGDKIFWFPSKRNHYVVVFDMASKISSTFSLYPYVNNDSGIGGAFVNPVDGMIYCLPNGNGKEYVIIDPSDNSVSVFDVGAYHLDKYSRGCGWKRPLIIDHKVYAPPLELRSRVLCFDADTNITTFIEIPGNVDNLAASQDGYVYGICNEISSIIKINSYTHELTLESIDCFETKGYKFKTLHSGIDFTLFSEPRVYEKRWRMMRYNTVQNYCEVVDIDSDTGVTDIDGYTEHAISEVWHDDKFYLLPFTNRYVKVIELEDTFRMKWQITEPEENNYYDIDKFILPKLTMFHSHPAYQVDERIKFYIKT